jgi:predicted small lipoprotein YifL
MREAMRRLAAILALAASIAACKTAPSASPTDDERGQFAARDAIRPRDLRRAGRRQVRAA